MRTAQSTLEALESAQLGARWSDALRNFERVKEVRGAAYLPGALGSEALGLARYAFRG